LAKKRTATRKHKRAVSPASPSVRHSLVSIAGTAAAMQLAAWYAIWEVFGDLHISYRFFELSDITDPYYPYAVNIARGMAAYRDFFIEYPPLFVPLLLLGGNPAQQPRFVAQFAMIMALFMVAAGVVCAVAAADGTSISRPYIVGALFALFVLLLGPISANRYDAAVALVLAVALLFMMRQNWTAASVALGLGFALKITPAILLPIVLVLAPPRRAVRALVGFGVAAVVPFVWVLSLGGSSGAALGRMLGYHLSRPLEIESVLAAPLWVARLAGLPIKVGLGAGSQVIESGLANAIASASALVLLAALGATFSLVWRRRETILAEPRLIALAALATILGSLVGSKVLSPQYFVWIVPAVALVAINRKVLGATVGVAEALTQLLFPANYFALSGHQLTGPILIVIVRNLLVVAAFALSLRHLWKLPVSGPLERPA
jgi:hypothetical protein